VVFGVGEFGVHFVSFEVVSDVESDFFFFVSGAFLGERLVSGKFESRIPVPSVS